MECLSDFLDRKAALEPGWGGPGEVKALLDDGVPPGPGEEEYERQEDEWIQRRVLMLEETVVRRGRGPRDKIEVGKGPGGMEGTGLRGGSWW